MVKTCVCVFISAYVHVQQVYYGVHVRYGPA